MVATYLLDNVEAVGFGNELKKMLEKYMNFAFVGNISSKFLILIIKGLNLTV